MSTGRVSTGGFESLVSSKYSLAFDRVSNDSFAFDLVIKNKINRKSLLTLISKLQFN